MKHFYSLKTGKCNSHILNIFIMNAKTWMRFGAVRSHQFPQCILTFKEIKNTNTNRETHKNTHKKFLFFIIFTMCC